jgi:hypothetical protein
MKHQQIHAIDPDEIGEGTLARIVGMGSKVHIVTSRTGSKVKTATVRRDHFASSGEWDVHELVTDLDEIDMANFAKLIARHLAY